MDGVCYEPLESKADNPCYKCDDFTQKLEYFICKYHMNFSCLDLPFSASHNFCRLLSHLCIFCYGLNGLPGSYAFFVSPSMALNT